MQKGQMLFQKLKKNIYYFVIIFIYINFAHKEYTKMKTRNEITNSIAEYFKSQPVNKAWIFGSFARGEETQDSDVDILVTLDYSKHIGLRYFGMALELEKILGRKVDLVEDNQLMSFAKPSADHDKILIYEREGS